MNYHLSPVCHGWLTQNVELYLAEPRAFLVPQPGIRYDKGRDVILAYGVHEDVQNIFNHWK